jgi:CheY-like chemotaxis protein
VSTKCPRCNNSLTATPDELGFVVCGSCGAKLRSKLPSVVKVQAAAPAHPGPADIDSVLARLDAPANPSATLPPGTPLKRIPRPGEPGAPAGPSAQAPPAPASTSGATLDAVLAELRTVRRLQEEMLGLLRSAAPPGETSLTIGDEPFTALDEPVAPPEPPPAVRSRRRKSVLLIDDDEKSRHASLEAFERAQVPVRFAADGSAGVAAIAMERPDVIVLELGVGGPMAGKDVINMIKATMEWVDIPIVLYTRLPVASQKEARTVHGADEYVLKDAGPDTLVGRVISLFRRG